MMKKQFIFYLLIILWITGCTDKGIPDMNRKNLPNIILIMADDLGYHDLGGYGNTSILSPHLDSLAANGAKFLDYHSNGVVCSPTRAALLTGRYQQRSGIEGVVSAKNHRHTGLKDHFTMASFLKEHNYRTGIVGKWHLGYDTLFSPLNNGFDYFKGYVSGNIDYHSHIDQVGCYDWWNNKDTLREAGYSTDLITRNSIDFIERNKEDNFFLYIAHEAPHYPYQGRNDPADRTINGQFDNLGSRTDRDAAYKEMIEVMDEGIGKLLDFLKSRDLLESTLIFFISDNGANRYGSNFPLKGFKGNVWEGGHRVPAIAFWEKTVPPGVIDQAIMSMDIFPTLVELVAGSIPEAYDFDGISLWPLLLDQTAEVEDRTLFWRFGDNKKALRVQHWKYICFNEDEYLYDLSKDMGEAHNLIDSFPILADSLRAVLKDWESEMSAFEILTE